VRRRLIIALFWCQAAVAATGAVPTTVATMSYFNVAIAMRDGVHLSANIFRPAAPGRYPTILVRTPYDKGDALTPNYQSFVNRGYAVMVQDVRGRYKSGGTFEPLNQEIADGDDTLNWIAGRPWSDGAVGMYGGSYLGIAQWKAAMTQNPHLKAIFPYVSGDDDYRDRFYSTGGAVKLGHRLLWLEENMRAPGYAAPDFRKYILALPVRAAGMEATGNHAGLWTTVVDHPAYDAFWKRGSVREHLKDIHVPVYSVAGWYDNYVESDLDAFSQLSKRSHADRIMVGPWAHVFNTAFPGVNFGPQSQVSLRPVQLEWFDQWLKGKDAGAAAHPVRLFVMGIDRWRDEDTWPLLRAREVKFYLGSGGHANTLNGDGVLAERMNRLSEADSFNYDPRNPVPTAGGAVCCDPEIFPWGPKDQRTVERRADVLVYSTPPLVSDTEVTGPIKLVLYASSSAPDTDFTAKLVDVYPNGMARNLTDGILRARYRQSLEAADLLTPGSVYRLTIDVGVTSNVFRAGHRIRLEVSSSNFPRFDRNGNTGGPVGSEKELRRAAQRVFHDRERHSYLLLPVVTEGRPELTSAKQTRYGPKRSSVASPPAMVR
jgi:uncharacterized protein